MKRGGGESWSWLGLGKRGRICRAGEADGWSGLGTGLGKKEGWRPDGAHRWSGLGIGVRFKVRCRAGEADSWYERGLGVGQKGVANRWRRSLVWVGDRNRCTGESGYVVGKSAKRNNQRMAVRIWEREYDGKFCKGVMWRG